MPLPLPESGKFAHPQYPGECLTCTHTYINGRGVRIAVCNREKRPFGNYPLHLILSTLRPYNEFLEIGRKILREHTGTEAGAGAGVPDSSAGTPVSKHTSPKNHENNS